MNEPWIPVALCAAVSLLALFAAGAAVSAQRRSRAEAESARAESAELRARVDTLATQLAHRPRVETEYVITQLDAGLDFARPAGDHSTNDTLPGRVAHEARAGVSRPQRIDGKLFADVVLRESVVKAAALTYGVRRALAPEQRHRIRWEMRREVKRSRKERKARLRAARRALEAEARRVVHEDGSTEDAA